MDDEAGGPRLHVKLEKSNLNASDFPIASESDEEIVKQLTAE